MKAMISTALLTITALATTAFAYNPPRQDPAQIAQAAQEAKYLSQFIAITENIPQPGMQGHLSYNSAASGPMAGKIIQALKDSGVQPTTREGSASTFYVAGNMTLTIFSNKNLKGSQPWYGIPTYSLSLDMLNAQDDSIVKHIRQGAGGQMARIVSLMTNPDPQLFQEKWGNHIVNIPYVFCSTSGDDPSMDSCNFQVASPNIYKQ